jgi:hypothetical protein
MFNKTVHFLGRRYAQQAQQSSESLVAQGQNFFSHKRILSRCCHIFARPLADIFLRAIQFQ